MYPFYPQLLAGVSYLNPRGRLPNSEDPDFRQPGYTEVE